jgi:hypothetical protein
MKTSKTKIKTVRQRQLTKTVANTRSHIKDTVNVTLTATTNSSIVTVIATQRQCYKDKDSTVTVIVPTIAYQRLR